MRVSDPMTAGLLLALLLAASCGDAGTAPEQSHVDRAKAVDVAILDASLPSQRLEEWLRAVVPDDRSIRWSPGDCDGRTCVRLDIEDSGLKATALIEPGREPRLRSFEVPPYAVSPARLSALPDLLARAAATIAYAKALDVQTLDAALPSQPLDDWLRRGPLGLEDVRWSVSDCAIKPVDDDRDRDPLCVDFRFGQGTVRGVGIIRVGTLGGGLAPPASLMHVLLTARKESGTESAVTSKLAELPALVTRHQR